jgi:hypothetical protein
MTDIEAKALALVNEMRAERGGVLYYELEYVSASHTHEALCRAIEQHEAFKQEVGFALSNEWHNLHYGAKRNLDRFRIPLPKPDPLEEVIAECDDGTWETIPEYAKKFRAALDALGFEIREKGQ